MNGAEIQAMLKLKHKKQKDLVAALNRVGIKIGVSELSSMLTGKHYDSPKRRKVYAFSEEILKRW